MTATTGGELLINMSGGSALAKAGTGDVLAGAITGLAASGMPLGKAAALAAYLHGRAGDRLAAEYSDFGVIAEDLPKAIAREIAFIQK
jgi:NAD(P)H-hydrate epimerase